MIIRINDYGLTVISTLQNEPWNVDIFNAVQGQSVEVGGCCKPACARKVMRPGASLNDLLASFLQNYLTGKRPG